MPHGEHKTRWNIQFLCFTLSAIHLGYAHIKNMIYRLPSLSAFAQLGWLTMVIGIYFLVLSLVLKVAFPPFGLYFILLWFGFYLIFAEQKGSNFFKNFGKSLANFFPSMLSALGNFGDIMSYIRLFAVGFTGSSIAQSFNDLAVPAGGLGIGLNFVLRLVAASLILVAGHSLNVTMSSLSVIFHGVRLNLLEYADNHLGMQWTGYSYKPFANRQLK
jgi:V/A-type H+-transporting ATPase subunit I